MSNFPKIKEKCAECGENPQFHQTQTDAFYLHKLNEKFVSLEIISKFDNSNKNSASFKTISNFAYNFAKLNRKFGEFRDNLEFLQTHYNSLRIFCEFGDEVGEIGDYLQPFSNLSPTFRQPFADLSPTFRQPCFCIKRFIASNLSPAFRQPLANLWPTFGRPLANLVFATSVSFHFFLKMRWNAFFSPSKMRWNACCRYNVGDNLQTREPES